MNLASVRKTVINILTAIGTATPWILNALHESPFQGTQTATVVSGLLAFIGMVLHYLVPNTTTDPAVAATQSVKLVSPNV